jgi:RNA polymerase sigma-70 factor (ECF subfamily)
MPRELIDPEVAQLTAGREKALAALFSHYQDRLARMVRFRLDQRLWGRVDPADVLQESFIEISRRLDDYLRDPAVPVFVWLRSMTAQMLVNVHRRHLGAKMRDATLEVSMHRPMDAAATSLSLAARLAANLTSPSQAAIRGELVGKLREAFETMDPIDREVLALRHFEELSNGEVAEVLGLQKSTASNRYVRALKRLRAVMAQAMPTTEELL